jgi:hypothetical protein
MSAHAQYAGVGAARFESPTIAVSSTGSNLSPGTLYFFVQAHNRVGANLLSEPVSVSWSNQSTLTWTIPASFAPEAADVRRWTLSASTTDDETTAAQICQVEAYEADGSKISLPHSIALNNAEHVKVAHSVFSQASLPSAGALIHGMLRGVEHVYRTNADGSTTDLGGYIYRYNAHSLLTEDLPARIASQIGVWERWGTFLTYYGDSTTEEGGCDRSLFDVAETDVELKQYAADGSLSDKVRFWLFYDRQIGGSPAEAGRRMSVDLEIDGEPFNQLLKTGNRCQFTFLGYSDRLTGDLDVFDLDLAGTTRNLSFGQTAYDLEKDLPAASAICFDLAIQLDKNEFSGELSEGTAISVAPKWMPAGGEYIKGISRLYGNIALTEEIAGLGSGICRVIPTTGLSATIQHGRLNIYDYSVYSPRQTLYGFQQTTATQKVVTDGNAYWRVVSGTTAVTEPEALRAIVKCESGESRSGAVSGWTAITSGGISVFVEYPEIVRSDYPDVIAGEAGSPNAPAVNLYIENQASGEIRRFGPLTKLPYQPDQTFSIENFDGEIVTSRPSANPSQDFGCYDPGLAYITSSSGSFPTGSYRVSYSFVYTGVTITSVNHTPTDEHIGEMRQRISDIAYENELNTFTKHQASAIVTLSDARTIIPDGNAGNIYELNLSANWGVRTILPPQPVRPGTYQFIVHQGLGNQRVTWSGFNFLPSAIPEVPAIVGESVVVSCVATANGALYCTMTTPDDGSSLAPAGTAGVQVAAPTSTSNAPLGTMLYAATNQRLYVCVEATNNGTTIANLWRYYSSAGQIGSVLRPYPGGTLVSSVGADTEPNKTIADTDIFWYLGTNQLTTTYTNPIDGTRIVQTNSGVNSGAGTPVVLADRSHGSTAATNYTSTAVASSFFTLNFGANVRVEITKVSIQQRGDAATGLHRTLSVLYSSNGTTFTQATSFVASTSQGGWSTFDVSGFVLSQYLRLTQTSTNSSGATNFSASELILHGTITYL